MFPYNIPMPQITSQLQEPQYVNGRASAEVFQMAPNQKGVLFDSNKDTFYFIQTDASGIKSIKECEYHIVEPEKMEPADYVKRAEFDEIKAQIDKLTGMLAKNHNKPKSSDYGRKEVANE